MRTKPAGFAKGSPFGRAVERSETERVCSGRQPSPSRLRRATSPERERLWQGQKVYSLTVGFFLPLTNEDETYPLCQGLHLRGRWHFAKRNDGRGSSREQTLSVTASPCHLSRKGEALARAKSLQLNGGFFLPLTNKDETCPLCQGLHLRGSWHSRQAVTEGVLLPVLPRPPPEWKDFPRLGEDVAAGD